VSSIEQAVLIGRRTDSRFTTTGLVHRSDVGSQYTSLAFTDALRDSGTAGSIGSVGDALANALMESAIGVERETAAWVHWYNTSACTPR
jgi:transposase InsO family protein